jgi:hypothetical protein
MSDSRGCGQKERDVLKKAVVFLLCAVVWGGMSNGWCAEGQNRGAETIVIHAGHRGDVVFPHRQHQEREKDCQVCHYLFPQSAGSIERLKAEGTLYDKEVMIRLCLKCHRDRRQEGKPSGPTTCNACHKRP